MTQVLTDETLRRVIRGQVCPVCALRPPGSESLGPLITRPCEGSCAIFRHLEPLKRLAVQGADDPRADFERAIRDQVCQTCTLAPSAGDYCADRFARTCPLSVHAREVLLIIESVLMAYEHVAGGAAPPGGPGTPGHPDA